MPRTVVSDNVDVYSGDTLLDEASFVGDTAFVDDTLVDVGAPDEVVSNLLVDEAPDDPEEVVDDTLVDDPEEVVEEYTPPWWMTRWWMMSSLWWMKLRMTWWMN